MSGEEERYLCKGGKLLFDMMSSLFRDEDRFYLKEGDLLLGAKRFEILETPGHSPGSLSIYWPERKALFTGDVLFHGGVGRTDFPEGDSKLLMKSIERLSRLETEVLLPDMVKSSWGRTPVLENFEPFDRVSMPTYNLLRAP